MRTVTTTPFGRRPVTAGLLAHQAVAQAPASVPDINKWDILRALSVARECYGISDRALAVLQVLLSFHGDDDLSASKPTIVFASNAAICRRAYGMPESTLRRHIAALVDSGLILRHDSPNGKRYARRDSNGDITRAFGFDLRPLLILAPDIAHKAAEMSEQIAKLNQLREEVSLMLRDAVKLILYAQHSGQGGHWDALDDRAQLARRFLRRKLTIDQVSQLHSDLTDMLNDIRSRIDQQVPHPCAETRETANDIEITQDQPVDNITTNTQQTDKKSQEMSGNHAENERHYQSSKTKQFDSEKIPLRLVLETCTDVLPYADGPVRDWNDLVQMMTKLAPMTGIDANGWAEACRTMGPKSAAATLAAMVQRIGDISSPGAYLRSLSRKSAEGRFSPIPMLVALGHKAAA